jgi:hypothetical protein
VAGLWGAREEAAIRLTCAIALVVGLVPPVLADTLVFFDENGGATGPRGLYDFATGTGLATLRVAVGGVQRFFSLTMQPGTGRVYAADPNIGAMSMLWTLDVNTGIATLVGGINSDVIANIAFDPATGVLYGLGRNSSVLYTINTATGTPTQVGATSFVHSGLAFSSGGQLYGTSGTGFLYSIDKATGGSTLIGGPGIGSLVEDAAFTPQGNLYITDFHGRIDQVNPATGAIPVSWQTGFGDGLLGLIATPTVFPPPPSCYANCDNSTTPPVLNVLDFTCFLNEFAAGDTYANCDQSTTPPILNILDFECFLNKFAAGCS